MLFSLPFNYRKRNEHQICLRLIKTLSKSPVDALY